MIGCSKRRLGRPCRMRELTGLVRWLTISLPVWLPQTSLFPPAGSTVSPPFSFVWWVLCGVNETLSPPPFFWLHLLLLKSYMCLAPITNFSPRHFLFSYFLAAAFYYLIPP
ncbi:hypothetical protein IWX49DRAFT_300282 [Phyllosticta citricarpa]|uniref:Uncharacterized protein n=2 Tax=Phyllosticta TaxID=121621 RepID=A0ABR1LGU6_9PEZI